MVKRGTDVIRLSRTMNSAHLTSKGKDANEIPAQNYRILHAFATSCNTFAKVF